MGVAKIVISFPVGKSDSEYPILQVGLRVLRVRPVYIHTSFLLSVCGWAFRRRRTSERLLQRFHDGAEAEDPKGDPKPRSD